MINTAVKIINNEVSEQLVGVSGKIKEMIQTNKGTAYRITLESKYYGNVWFYENEFVTR